MDKYNFTFEEIRILEVEFKVKKPEKVGEIEVNPSLNFGHKTDGKFLEVNLGISFDHPAAPFKFNIVAFGKFKFKKNIDETFGDKINEVAIVNCSSIIFPFIRETVAELTRKAGFNPMLLPPVNFVNILKSIGADDTKKCTEPNNNE
jgi:preprotein translocase subunit SecB